MKHQRGLSLIELMISITISMFLMLGVMQIYLSSKQTYRTTAALSRIQESGRFALGFLTQDIRSAGYKGQCMGDPNNHIAEDAEQTLSFIESLKGWNDVGSSFEGLNRGPTSNTDVIRVKLAAGPSDIEAQKSNRMTTEEVNLTQKSSIASGAVALLSDGAGCDLFINAARPNDKFVKASDGKGWSHDYTGLVEVLGFNNTMYFVRENKNGIRSLVRNVLVPNSSGGGPTFTTEELVEGVYDMQFLYGVTGADMQVTDYVAADEVVNWDAVASVQVDLLIVSADVNVVPDDQIITYRGRDVVIPDKRMAKLFSTTVSLRNRLP